MPLSDKSNHLSSEQHKNKTKQQHIWCEDCGKYNSDKTRHFQGKIHTLRSQTTKLVKIRESHKTPSVIQLRRLRMEYKYL